MHEKASLLNHRSLANKSRMSHTVEISEAEARLGFEAQTIVYFDQFDLPLDIPSRRLERATILWLDDLNRIRRRSDAPEYVHESLVDEEWREVESFSSLTEIEASAVYLKFQARLKQDSGHNGNNVEGDDENI